MTVAAVSATAIAHPNVALVKYWGKRTGEDNVPATPSLSITLDGLSTRTTATADATFDADRVMLNGVLVRDSKIDACLARLKARGKSATHLRIESINDFPTAAGLASSASGFAALVVAVDAVLGLGMTDDERADEARRASASAARSLFGGFVTLETNRPQQLLPATDWPLGCVVAVCAESQKAVSSSEGMRASRDTSPFYEAWVDAAHRDYSVACEAVRNRDFHALAAVAEANCLAMHAVMLSSRPALIYWNEATVAVIHAVRELREAGTPVFFTIDAGPQVKAVCANDARRTVELALRRVGGVVRVIAAGIGEGARIEPSA